MLEGIVECGAASLIMCLLSNTSCSHRGYHQDVGRMFIVMGLMLVAVGVLLTLGNRFPLGRLPGDIVVRGKNSVFYFPIVTCVIVSAVLSLVMWLLSRR